MAVDLKPYFRNSVSVLQRLRQDIAAFCCKEQTPQALKAAQESLFRAILLDGITMLELIGEKETWKMLKAIQKDLLSTLRENRPVTLAKRLSLPDLDYALEGYITLILHQIG